MNQGGGSQQAPVSAVQAGQSRTRFNKRKRTSGIEDQFYEINLLTFFLFHAEKQKKDGQIEGFYLASNVDEAGALDDLVYRIDSKDHNTGNTKSTIHFLQAKHRVNPKNEMCLQDSFLKPKKGDFSLEKYYIAYKDIKQKYSVYNNDPILMRNFEDCHFIIYTNNKFKIDADSEFQMIKNEDESVWNLNENVGNYFYQISSRDKYVEVKNALTYVTDCRKLARELAKCVSTRSSISEKTPIFDKYREPLLQKVFLNNKLQKGFLEGHANLSPDDRVFREAFFKEIQILHAFKNKNEDQIKLEISNRNLNISPTFVPSANKSNTSIKSLPSDSLMQVEIEEFLKKLKLFIGQPSQSELKDIIIKKLVSTYSENDSELIFEYVQKKVKKWWENDTFYLTDEDKYFETAQQNILKLKCDELMISQILNIQKLDLSFIGTKLNNCQRDLKDLITNKRIINIVTDTNTMSLVKAKVYQALETIDECKSQKYIFLSLSATLRSLDGVIGTFKTGEYNLLAIHCDGKEKDTVEELFNQLINIITDYDTKKIIIIAQKSNQLAEKFKINSGNNYVEIVCKNNNLTDLTQESWENIFEKQVTFQGNEVCIGKLISYNSKHLIGAEELSDLINNEEVKIGKTPLDLGDVGNYYINRVFKYNNTISDKCFTDNHTNECFAVSNISEDELQRLVCSKNIMSNDKEAGFDKSRFFILDEELGEFEQLSRNKDNDNKIIHWLKKDGAKFKWLKSHGSVGNLRKYLDTSSVEEIQENDIFSLSDRIIIVSGEPGMGKSIVLTKLLHSKHFDELCWRIRINLNNNTKSLAKLNPKKIEDEAINFLLDASELTTPLERALFKDKLAAQDQMVLFIDGYDDICPTYAETVIKLLRYLHDTKAVKIIITTRSNMTVKLEDELSLFACSLKPLNRDDQIKFLQKFWTKNINYDLNNNRSYSYIVGILDYWSRSIIDTEVKFTGIPLQTRMIADIFQDEFKKFYDSVAEEPNFSNNLDIFNIYQLFTDKKFIIFCTEKMREDITNVSVQVNLQDSKEHFESKHMLLALSTLLPDEEVNKLLSKGEARRLKDLKENVNKGREKTGIVIQMDMDNNKPIFVHRTFAEYYAAYWFGDNIDKEYAKRFLLEHLFEEDFKVVRHFFDRFLCNDHQVIITTLNNDTHTLNNLLTQKTKEVICECDEEGRTALHLASAYGYLDIVKILLKHIDIYVSDKLFGWRPLTYATKNSHWNVVELLLQEGASSDDLVLGLNNPEKKYGYKNNTLLHIAAEQGYSKLAETLVNKYGNIVNMDNLDGETPLHLAAYSGHLEVLRVLLEHDADVNARTEDGRTPLHLSADNSESEVTTCLVQNNADINAQDKYGLTPLHLSAAKGELEVTTCLVRQNSDINARDKDGRTPLHHSAANGALEVIKWLVQQNAEINARDKGFQTPLHCSARYGKLEVIQCFVLHGADVNARDKDGRTPLHLSARNGRLECTECLIQHNADVNARDEDDRTPLHVSADCGKLEVTECLIQHGADVDARDKYGLTPLHLSAANGELEVTCLFLQNADINAVDRRGRTPLHLSAANGKLEVTKWLVQKNAETNARDEQGWSPLHISAWQGQLDIVKILLENGASLSVTEDGLTVLRTAVDGGNLEVVQYLVEQGNADINEINESGESLLQYAINIGKSDVAEYLLSKGATNDGNV